MAVLITGGYGHIGSWSALLLARQGREVILWDSSDVRPDYLDEVEAMVTFIKGDILDFAALRDMFEQHGRNIEAVIHTIGVMGELVQLNPRYHVRLNVVGLINVLELARVSQVPRVLYTSSGAVYGVAASPAAESLPLVPTDLYAATKVAAEHIGVHYAQTFGIDFRVARLYFVYGPGKYPSRFIRLYQLAFGVLEGMDGLHANRGGDQRLDFTYVEDAARGIVLLLNAENLQHRAFNIATGEAHPVGEVVALARRFTHFPVEVDIGPGELMRRCEALDISRAQHELGYAPRVGLEEGVRRYADWLKVKRRT
jgi:nucleoside-diphosphate-sugar epimerase